LKIIFLDHQKLCRKFKHDAANDLTIILILTIILSLHNYFDNSIKLFLNLS